MSYVALYRKWRPQAFADVVGQDSIVKTLSNALKSGRISHAYLFTGPRGIGKTTVARILAKGLNCQTGPTASPCGECEECVAITEGTSLNVIEIDGASNRGIDNVRELRGQVQYTPVNARYKVYIIDEVHMLTTEAFNALLKTLEEPPAHVIFIFATTDPHKLPSTILSRVQRHDFQRFGEEAMVFRLQTVSNGEGFKTEPEALRLIAQYAEGGMRDALGILEKCAAYTDYISLDAVVEVLGVAPQEQVRAFAQSILAGSGSEALGLIADVHNNGRDLAQFVRSTVTDLRRRILECRNEELEPSVLYAMKILTEAVREMRFAAEPRICLEVAALKAISGADTVAGGALEELETKINTLEKEIIDLRGQLQAASARFKETPPRGEEDAQDRPRLQRGSSDEERSKFVLNNWSEFLQALRRERLMQCEAFLKEGSPVEVLGDDVIVSFTRERGFHRASIEQPNHREPAERVLAKLSGMNLRLKCVFQDEYEVEKPKLGGGESDKLVEAEESKELKELKEDAVAGGDKGNDQQKQQKFIDISLDTFGGRVFKRPEEK